MRQQDRLEQLKGTALPPRPSQGICWMPGAACLAGTQIARVDFDDVGLHFKSSRSCSGVDVE